MKNLNLEIKRTTIDMVIRYSILLSLSLSLSLSFVCLLKCIEQIFQSNHDLYACFPVKINDMFGLKSTQICVTLVSVDLPQR